MHPLYLSLFSTRFLALPHFENPQNLRNFTNARPQHSSLQKRFCKSHIDKIPLFQHIFTLPDNTPTQYPQPQKSPQTHHSTTIFTSLKGTKKEPPQRKTLLYKSLIYNQLFAQCSSNIHSNSNSSTYHWVV